jgi:hypothetical protein
MLDVKEDIRRLSNIHNDPFSNPISTTPLSPDLASMAEKRGITALNPQS